MFPPNVLGIVAHYRDSLLSAFVALVAMWPKRYDWIPVSSQHLALPQGACLLKYVDGRTFREKDILSCVI
eukprot:764656-Hanusia_phi.AAC.1